MALHHDRAQEDFLGRRKRISRSFSFLSAGLLLFFALLFRQHVLLDGLRVVVPAHRTDEVRAGKVEGPPGNQALAMEFVRARLEDGTLVVVVVVADALAFLVGGGGERLHVLHNLELHGTLLGVHHAEPPLEGHVEFLAEQHAVVLDLVFDDLLGTLLVGVRKQILDLRVNQAVGEEASLHSLLAQSEHQIHGRQGLGQVGWLGAFHLGSQAFERRAQLEDCQTEVQVSILETRVSCLHERVDNLDRIIEGLSILHEHLHDLLLAVDHGLQYDEEEFLRKEGAIVIGKTELLEPHHHSQLHEALEPHHLQVLGLRFVGPRFFVVALLQLLHSAFSFGELLFQSRDFLLGFVKLISGLL